MGATEDMRQIVFRLIDERDAARAEVERVNKQLEQAIAERTPHDYGILKEEAQEMRKQRDEARAEVERLKSESNLLVRQRDEARNELQPLKLELSCALAAEERAKKSRDEAWCRAMEAESSTVNESLPVRSEPSRLEIAATLVAGRFSSTSYVTEVKGTWIQYALKGADALIEAAKEGK